MAFLDYVYRFFFKIFRGKGFGLGIFNRIHRAYETYVQPKFVTVNGCILFLPSHDEGVSDSLRMEDTWEPELTREFERVIKTGMTVLDVGANVGYHTLLASRLVGKNGHVLSFEPDPSNLALLEKNIQANRCANVQVFPFAVGAAERTVELNLCSSTAGAHSTAYVPEGGHDKITVRMVRLDDFLNPELQPNVVKMDIEGGEAQALEGMARILADSRLTTVFIECSPPILAKLGSSPSNLLKKLERVGFSSRQLDHLNWLCTRDRQ